VSGAGWGVGEGLSVLLLILQPPACKLLNVTQTHPPPQIQTQAGKRWIHVASTEASQQPDHAEDYDACLRLLLEEVKGLAREEAQRRADAAVGGEVEVEEVARELVAMAVKVHRGWERRGPSPAYNDELQRQLVEGLLGGLLGPHGQEALTPPEGEEE